MLNLEELIGIVCIMDKEDQYIYNSKLKREVGIMTELSNMIHDLEIAMGQYIFKERYNGRGIMGICLLSKYKDPRRLSSYEILTRQSESLRES